MVDVVVAVTLPLIGWAVLGLIDPAVRLWPGSVLVGLVVLVAVWRGTLAALLSTIVAVIVLWWAYSRPSRSFALPATEAGGLLVFTLVSVALVALVHRLRQLVDHVTLRQQLAETLIEEAPVGLAFFDRERRFRMVNRRLAVMNGRPVEEHLGRRPAELTPLQESLYEHLLTEVLDSGRPVLDRELSVEEPTSGIERHWRASYYPVEVGRERVGVGATVQEVTGEVVARRRAERLLHLSSVLGEVERTEDLAQVLADFLHETYRAHAAVALVEGTGLRITALCGYDATVTRQWRGTMVPLAHRTPMTDAVREQQTVAVASADAFPAAYDPAERAIAGEVAILATPIGDATDPARAMGALRLGWTAPHELSVHGQVLLQTVVAMVEGAWARLRLRDKVEEDRFRAAFDALLEDIAINEAVRDARGRIEDFVIVYANAASRDGAGRGAEDITGRLVSALYPGAKATGLLDRYIEVVETGIPFTAERLRYEDRLPDGTVIEGYWNLQVTRFGDGYLAASRDVTELVEADRVAEENRRLAEVERTTVDLLQQAALPIGLPEVPGLAFSALYQPASADQPIGGDWYDAFSLPDGRVALVIADGAGHGREAASLMVRARNTIRALAIEHRDPGRVLERANRALVVLDQLQGPFVTCCYAILDLASGHLVWSRAGHFAPLLGRSGRPEYSDGPGGPPLAAFPEAHYPQSRAQLVPGDRIVLFTDGLIERKDRSLDDSLAALVDLAADCSDEDAQGCIDILGRSVVDQFDDLAVLCVDLLDTPPPA